MSIMIVLLGATIVSGASVSGDLVKRWVLRAG